MTTLGILCLISAGVMMAAHAVDVFFRRRRARAFAQRTGHVMHPQAWRQ